MVNIGYTLGIPATNNNPSTDQPNMLINNDAVNQIIGIDHIAFNAAEGGTHKQVTFSSENTPGAQVDPASTLFTGVGTASAFAQLLYKNEHGTFPVSCIRAFGVFHNTGSLISALDNGYNVASISGSVGGLYTITLAANAVTGNNICVLTDSSSASASISWSFANPVLSIQANANSGVITSFAVLQF